MKEKVRPTTILMMWQPMCLRAKLSENLGHPMKLEPHVYTWMFKLAYYQFVMKCDASA